MYMKQPDYYFLLYAIGMTSLLNYILINQGYKGAYFFIPKLLRKNYYNYHKTKVEIQTLNIDFNSLDCTICLKTFYSHPDESDNLLPKDANALIDDECIEKLMITPCKHVFHSECLERWVIVKLECPLCKQQIPYIE